MTLTSKFSRKGLFSDLILYLITALAMVTIGTVSRRGLIVTVVIVGIVLAIAVAIWLFRLKVIIVSELEIEVRRAILPSSKHYYRFAEFDSFLLYQSGKTEYLYLLRQGQRILKLSSDIYENYEELKNALSIIGGETWGVDAARAVDSVFSKKHLLAVSFLFLFVFVGLAVPVSDYFEKGYVRESSLGIGLVVALFFLFLVIVALYPYKYLTIWRGNLEVKHLLWPFKVKYYSIEDFDFTLEIITKHQQDKEESLWLIRNGKLAVDIPQSVYSNYDALKHAIGIVPSDTIEMGMIQALPYYFGKTFRI